MSNFLAVATVTATLGELVQAAISREVPGSVPGAVVTFLPPNSKEIDHTTPAVNIYLYQISRNVALADADLPTRRADGSVIQRPAAAIDLEYVLTFFGDDRSLEPQRLLGTVVAELHAIPLLSRGLIESTLPHYPYLATSNLAQAVDLVKFSVVPLTLHEISNLWSSLFHAEYSLSVVYCATVVLLDGPGRPEVALPVRRPVVFVNPFREPVITRVRAKGGSSAPIVTGAVLVITGNNLRGETTRVALDGQLVVPDTVSDIEISLTLAVSRLPWLRAGILGVEVAHLRSTPDSGEVRGATSNLVPVVLSPTITDLEVQTVGAQVSLVATLSPVVGPSQEVTVLLNRLGSPGLQGYAFAADVRTADQPTVTFPITDVEPGDYLVRVQVDRAQSRLEVDTTPKSPTFRQYVSPQVALPQGAPSP